MNRAEFEALRDLPGKRIDGSVVLTQRRETSPLLVAENSVVDTSYGVDAKITVTYNPETDSKVVNVHIPGGPICRLCVDANMHIPCGRNHKHSLQTESCSRRNLPDGAVDRPDLAGKTLAEVFRIFCEISQIDFGGEVRIEA